MSLREKLQSSIKWELSEQQISLLFAHLEYVVEQNQRVNLTSIENLESGVLLHIEDSLSALDAVNSAPPGRMVDIGSGGGLPGIPLAIVTGRQTLLVDSTTKKVEVLRGFIHDKQLKGLLAAEALRAEELALTRRAEFSVVTARALSELPSILELAAPLLSDKGVLIAFKGKPQTVEIERAKDLEDILGLRLVQQQRFFLSDEETKRTLLVFEKFADATISLPRRNGMAQKRPLA